MNIPVATPRVALLFQLSGHRWHHRKLQRRPFSSHSWDIHHPHHLGVPTSAL
uniref:Auxin-responsive protein n=1 Tax=Rhizophora mucronata TaxID=61149 RepID=A0A2P2P2Y4_RHIMU